MALFSKPFRGSTRERDDGVDSTSIGKDVYVGGSGLGDVMLWRDFKGCVGLAECIMNIFVECVWMFVKLR